MTLHLRSPAKINLFLHLKGKRGDGYHDLATLMQTISFFDEIALSLTSRDEFQCNEPGLQTASNLVCRARDLFRKKTDWQDPVAISLTKKIPIQAGLGGGSSNAATLLWGLNQLSGLKIQTAVLMEWASELGSDVPFFFSTGTAYCTGRGDHVTPLSPLPPRSLQLVLPDVPLSTKRVYASAIASPRSDRSSEAFLQAFITGNPRFENELEEGALQLEPALRELKGAYERSGARLAMTGSGSAFFSFDPLTPLPHSSVQQASYIHRQNGDWYS